MSASWVMTNVDAVLNSLNDLTIVRTVFIMILIYVGFIAIYLFATYLVYALRYVKDKKKLDQYKGHLKALNQMYEREEKLKL